MGEISSVPFHDSVFHYIRELSGLQFYKTLTQKEKEERKKPTVGLGSAQAMVCNYVPLKHNKSVHRQPSI